MNALILVAWRVFLGVLCGFLSGEFGITMFDSFAVTLLDAAEIDSASGDKVLEAAGCLGANLDPRIIRPAKTC